MRAASAWLLAAFAVLMVVHANQPQRRIGSDGAGPEAGSEPVPTAQSESNAESESPVRILLQREMHRMSDGDLRYRQTVHSLMHNIQRQHQQMQHSNEDEDEDQGQDEDQDEGEGEGEDEDESGSQDEHNDEVGAEDEDEDENEDENGDENEDENEDGVDVEQDHELEDHSADEADANADANADADSESNNGAARILMEVRAQTKAPDWAEPPVWWKAPPEEMANADQQPWPLDPNFPLSVLDPPPNLPLANIEDPNNYPPLADPNMAFNLDPSAFPQTNDKVGADDPSFASFSINGR